MRRVIPMLRAVVSVAVTFAARKRNLA